MSHTIMSVEFMCWKFGSSFFLLKICPISTRSIQCVSNRIAFELFALLHLSWSPFTSLINFAEKQIRGRSQNERFSNFSWEFCRQICDLIENQSLFQVNWSKISTNQRNFNFRIDIFHLAESNLYYSFYKIPLLNSYYTITWHTQIPTAIQNSIWLH